MTEKFESLLMKIIAVAMAVLFCATVIVCLIPDATSPASKNNGSVSDGNTVTSGKKKVAFTFDDGPQAPAEDLENGFYPYTMYILDKLDELDMRATFFVLGNRASTYSNAITRAKSLGCEIGSHTYDHQTKFIENGTPVSDDTVKSVLKQASDAIAAASGEAPKLFRPVGGAVNEHQLGVIHGEGYVTVGWSVDSLDWDGRPSTGDKLSSESARNEKYWSFVNSRVDSLLSQIEDGDIVLMHDIYMSSADIFILRADKLVENGFELVTVSEILADATKDGTRPVMYTSSKETLLGMN